MLQSGQLNEVGIDVLRRNNQNPENFSYLDYYWTVGISGRMIEGYIHRETRNKPQ